MNRLIGCAVLSAVTLIAARPVYAQTAGVGYVFGAPGFASCCGDSTALLHTGGGGEARIGDSFGIGADVGYIAPFEYFSDGLGLLSVNATYYFPLAGRQRRTQPFVTSGYSMLFREGTLNLWNIGGGADYWVHRGVGIRLEIRDHIHAERGETMHLWGPRVGIMWRLR